MRVVFFGTPKFAVPALKILVRAGHEAALVITQPDKPVGRGLKPLPSSVKEEAKLLNLPLLQPDNLEIQEVKDKFKEISPEIIVVVAYGKIIPKWLLDLPKYGCINVHASLLPAYRGAAPIQRAIIDGQKTTGITTMLMDEELDTGDILLQAEIPIFEEETSGELEKRLSQLGAEVLLKTIEGLKRGTLKSKKQDKSKATCAPKIEKQEVLIDWSNSADKIKNLVRALNPHPGAHTIIQGKRVKIWRAKVINLKVSRQEAGSVLLCDGKEGLAVACGSGHLLLEEMQPEGKGKMTGAEFCRGHKIQFGEKLKVP